MDGSLAWLGNVWIQGRDQRKENLEDLVKDPKLLASFLEDFSSRAGKALAAEFAKTK